MEVFFRLYALVLFTLWNGNIQTINCSSPQGAPDVLLLSLKQQLLTNYSAEFRPSWKTQVVVTVVPLSLNQLSIENQEMTLTAVVSLAWLDNRLSWDKSNYCQISSIVLRKGLLWEPEVYIENSVDKITIIGKNEEPPLRVISTGRVISNVPVVVRVFCQMHILTFPFDTQQCMVKFTVMGYSKDEVELIHNGQSNFDNVFKTYFSPNGQWDLLEKTETDSPGDQPHEFYSVFTVKVKFRRKWLFLFLSMIAPAVLNSILMSAVFALPFDSGEKMSYPLTVLLTYIVLMTLVTDSLPQISTEISALQIYLTIVMCVGTLANLLTVWNIMIYHRTQDTPIPNWLTKLCRNVLRPLLGKKPVDRKSFPAPHRTNSNKANTNEKSQSGLKNCSKRYSLGDDTAYTTSGPKHSRERLDFGSSPQKDKSSIDSLKFETHGSKVKRYFVKPKSNFQDQASSVHDTIFKEAENQEGYADCKPSIIREALYSRNNQIHASRERHDDGDNAKFAHVIKDNVDKASNHRKFDDRNTHHIQGHGNQSENYRKVYHDKDYDRKTAEEDDIKGQTQNGNEEFWSHGNDKNGGDEGKNPVVNSNGHNDPVTWQEVAELVDSVCLRLIGGFILVGTLCLLVFFLIVY